MLKERLQLPIGPLPVRTIARDKSVHQWQRELVVMGDRPQKIHVTRQGAACERRARANVGVGPNAWIGAQPALDLGGIRAYAFANARDLVGICDRGGEK